MNPIPQTLETPRLILRLPSEEDFDMIFSATRYEGFNDGMLWEPPENMEELKEPLRKGLEARKSGKAYGFTIVEKHTQEPIGRISIRKTDREQVWNVGFWTHPASQGKGIMTEALAEILRFGFEVLEAEAIEACHATWNLASEKVLKRNGMTFVEYLEKGFQKKGKWVPENLLSLSKSD